MKSNPIEIEMIIDSRGYTKGGHSLLLSQDFLNKEFQPLEFPAMTVDEWMRNYCALSNKDTNAHSTHIKMINHIVHI